MAHVQVDFFSQALQVGSSIDVIMPETADGIIGIETQSHPDPPVLYLFHGLSDDHTTWLRRTSVERYAAQYGLAVVMPAVGRSFYTDMVSGPAYWTYVTEELPKLVGQMFRLTESPDQTFVAGLSMGGYGAMKMALSFPDRYAAAASFSGAVDMRFRAPEDDGSASQSDPDDPFIRDLRLIYGDPSNIVGTGNDTFHLVSNLVESGTRVPDLYIACGSEDFLIEDNHRFHGHLTTLGVEHTYVTEPGTHEWGFWDRHIERFFSWLAERRLLTVPGAE